MRVGWFLFISALGRFSPSYPQPSCYHSVLTTLSPSCLSSHQPKPNTWVMCVLWLVFPAPISIWALMFTFCRPGCCQSQSRREQALWRVRVKMMPRGWLGLPNCFSRISSSISNFGFSGTRAANWASSFLWPGNTKTGRGKGLRPGYRQGTHRDRGIGGEDTYSCPSPELLQEHI